MEDLDRQPAAQRQETRADRIMVSDLHMHVGDRAVGDLLMGVVDRPLVTRMRRPREADDHPLREERAVAGSREEVAPGPAHDAEPSGHRRENVLQRPLARPPELVRVRVDHPVGAVVGRREPRHARHPRVLPHLVARLAEKPQAARTLVALEDLGRPVARAVVRRDHEVDTRMQVEGDLRIDDVGLVADEQRHDESHARQPRSAPSSYGSVMGDLDPGGRRTGAC